MNPQIVPLLALLVILLGQQPTITVEKHEAPPYPAIARSARIQAEVRLALVVARDGTVSEATVVDGHPMFRSAATDVIKKWRFACAGCEPEKPFRHEFVFTFRISEKQLAEREELWRKHAELKCSGTRRGKAKRECDEIDRRMDESCNDQTITSKLLANDRMEIEVVAPCINTETAR